MKLLKMTVSALLAVVALFLFAYLVVPEKVVMAVGITKATMEFLLTGTARTFIALQTFDSLELEPKDYGAGSQTGATDANARNVVMVINKGATGAGIPRMVRAAADPAFRFWTGMSISPGAGSSGRNLGATGDVWMDVFFGAGAIQSGEIEDGTLSNADFGASTCVSRHSLKIDPDETQVTYVSLVDSTVSTTATDVDDFGTQSSGQFYLVRMFANFDATAGAGETWTVDFYNQTSGSIVRGCTTAHPVSSCILQAPGVLMPASKQYLLRITPSFPGLTTSSELLFSYCLSTGT